MQQKLINHIFVLLSQRFLTFFLVRNHVVSYDQLTIAFKYFQWSMKHIWKLYQIIHCYTHTINLKVLGLLDSNAFISLPQSSTKQLCKFLDTDRKAPLAGCPQTSKWKQGRRKTLLTDFFFPVLLYPLHLLHHSQAFLKSTGLPTTLCAHPTKPLT